MKIIPTRAHRWLQVIGASAAALPLCAAVSAAVTTQVAVADNLSGSLVEQVRIGTARFRDINVAIREGYVAATPCVSGPDTGAMGVHMIHVANGQPDRVADGILNPGQPEALIYEPQADGAMRFVGVEFIEIAAHWNTTLGNSGAPAVAGDLMNLVSDPNRFGLPAFYELHVWAWENNPRGTFADWNTQVSCVHQREQ